MTKLIVEVNDLKESTMDFLIYLYVFILGTLIGSFLNVVVYRLPREESLSYPPSHCPKCNTRLKFMDLFPVFSYLFLKGKCRYCDARISVRYPLVELLTGLIYVYTFWNFGITPETILYVMIFSLLIPVFLIDYDHTIIPDRLNFGIFMVAALYFAFQIYNGNQTFRSLLNPLYGLLIGGGFFLFVAVVTKGAMGGGDIKLMAALGFLFGSAQTLLLMFLSFIIGGALSSLLLLFKIKKRKDYIPFGPFICISAFVVVFWGDKILNWYLN